MSRTFKKRKLVLGALTAFFAVGKPLAASILASLAMHSQLGPEAQALLLERAAMIDECNTAILDKTGDSWQAAKNYTLAAIAYGKAFSCSPGFAGARFKYGAMLILMGYPEETFSMNDAMALEPANPLFADFYSKLTARR